MSGIKPLPATETKSVNFSPESESGATVAANKCCKTLFVYTPKVSGARTSIPVRKTPKQCDEKGNKSKLIGEEIETDKGNLNAASSMKKSSKPMNKLFLNHKESKTKQTDLFCKKHLENINITRKQENKKHNYLELSKTFQKERAKKNLNRIKLRSKLKTEFSARSSKPWSGDKRGLPTTDRKCCLSEKGCKEKTNSLVTDVLYEDRDSSKQRKLSDNIEEIATFSNSKSISKIGHTDLQHLKNPNEDTLTFIEGRAIEVFPPDPEASTESIMHNFQKDECTGHSFFGMFEQNFDNPDEENSEVEGKISLADAGEWNLDSCSEIARKELVSDCDNVINERYMNCSTEDISFTHQAVEDLSAIDSSFSIENNVEDFNSGFTYQRVRTEPAMHEDYVDKSYGLGYYEDVSSLRVDNREKVNTAETTDSMDIFNSNLDVLPTLLDRQDANTDTYDEVCTENATTTIFSNGSLLNSETAVKMDTNDYHFPKYEEDEVDKNFHDRNSTNDDNTYDKELFHSDNFTHILPRNLPDMENTMLLSDLPLLLS